LYLLATSLKKRLRKLWLKFNRYKLYTVFISPLKSQEVKLRGFNEDLSWQRRYGIKEIYVLTKYTMCNRHVIE